MLVNATYLSANHVILYCENCHANVGAIHSSELLPFLEYMRQYEDSQPVLCFECEYGEVVNMVPPMLENTGKGFLTIDKQTFADFDDLYLAIPGVAR